MGIEVSSNKNLENTERAAHILGISPRSLQFQLCLLPEEVNEQIERDMYLVNYGKTDDESVIESVEQINSDRIWILDMIDNYHKGALSPKDEANLEEAMGIDQKFRDWVETLLVDDYVSGELCEEALSRLEKKLASDPDFRIEFEKRARIQEQIDRVAIMFAQGSLGDEVASEIEECLGSDIGIFRTEYERRSELEEQKQLEASGILSPPKTEKN